MAELSGCGYGLGMAERAPCPVEFTIRPDDPAQTLEEVWPPFGLRIESPRLVLRVIRETDYPQYVAAATSGVTRTENNPFAVAWNEKPPGELVRSSLPWLWSTRSRIGPDDWYLMLGVFLKGAADSGPAAQRLIGMQDCSAADWRVLRTVTSGSWLRADEQGQGCGREMRAAMLLWAFDHFGAEYAESTAYRWNGPSRAVSLGLGYEVTGARRVTDAYGQAPAIEETFRVAAAGLIRPEWPVTVSGSDALAGFFAPQTD